MKHWTRVRLKAKKSLLHSDEHRNHGKLSTPHPDLHLLDKNPLLHADKETFATLLRECGRQKSLPDAHRIHQHILNSGLDRDLFLSNLLVQMFANCGCLSSAKSIFDAIQDRNSVSWHMIMLAFAQHSHLHQVQQLFDQMPDFRKNTISWNIITTAYAQSGNLQQARILFDESPTKDVVSWNTIISACVRCDRPADAIQIFRRMDLEPDRITLVACIDGCASILARDLGKELHQRARIKNFHSHVVVATSLVNMYGKFGCIGSAKEAFDAVPDGGCDVVLSTSMLTAFSENGRLEEARDLFYSAARRDVVFWTSMIVACGLNGELDEAKRVFLAMPGRSVVSWNAMMAACVQNGDYRKTLDLLREMDVEGVIVDKVSCISALDAAANLTELELGRTIHREIAGDEELFGDAVLRTSLVNLYGKCGKLAEAREIFDGIVNKPIASWNAMISSYAQKGQGWRVFELYRLLNLDGKSPDLVTFICVISTCSHAGLIEDGRLHFHSITADYDSAPTKDHYSCFLDLLGRSGWLNEAEELVEAMPFEPNSIELTAVLGSCEIHGDVQRGKRVSGRFLEGDDDGENVGVAPYLLLSNLHAQTGNHDDVVAIRKIMVDRGIRCKQNSKFKK